MGAIPLPALSIRPPQEQPGPLDTYAKLLQLRAMQEQQKLIPGKLEEQQQGLQQGQQQIQSTGLDIQAKQLALQNQKISQSTLADPNFSKDFDDWQKSKGTAAPAAAGTTGAVPLHPLAQYLAERKGLPVLGPGGALDVSKQLTEGSQKLAELSKTKAKCRRTRWRRTASSSITSTT